MHKPEGSGVLQMEPRVQKNRQCVKREGAKERWWRLMHIIALSPLRSLLSEPSNYLDTKSSAGYTSLDIKLGHKEITGAS